MSPLLQNVLVHTNTRPSLPQRELGEVFLRGYDLVSPRVFTISDRFSDPQVRGGWCGCFGRCGLLRRLNRQGSCFNIGMRLAALVHCHSPCLLPQPRPCAPGPSQHPQHKSHPTSRALIHFANKEEASRAVRTLQNASWGQRRVQLKLLE